MKNPREYAKAIAAACTAAAGSLTTAASDGALTGVEVALVVITTLGAAAATYAIGNAEPAPSGEPSR